MGIAVISPTGVAVFVLSRVFNDEPNLFTKRFFLW